MRRRTLLLGTAISGTAAFAASGGRAARAPVVLELFTSQGCSSCPPADALLGELSHEPGVIALAWHVDYWNGLGWRDPYASAAWTKRQRAYAQRLGEEVYTPALVVNGTAMVVGSDAAATRTAMQRASQLPVGIMVRRTGDTVQATLEAVPQGATALRVLYQPQAATGVRAGENAGRQLREYRIVRDAAIIPARERTFTLSGVVDAMAAGMGVVLLIEDAEGKLIGAGDLPSP